MRICNENLEALARKGIKVPSYDRKNMKTAYVHIGLGHFHRSHFLTYLDTLLQNGDETQGIFEVDIMPAPQGFISSLREQDYMYSVLSLAPDGTRELRINGPITGYANASEEPGKVLEMLSSPDVRLVSLTITEKGYCYLDDRQSLDWDNPSIRHDIETDDYPRTAIGYLALALRSRKESGSPLTVMSCDNVPENGAMLKLCVLQFCRRKYPEIVDWVESSVSFPCTMVDRITPGTGPEDIAFLEKEYGIEDRCPVHSEDFIQWVIEDESSTPIPDFTRAGALAVSDVKPYELMKIRLLNGSHSALSYPAYMMGIHMVHEAASDPLIGRFIRERYMEEITATLLPVPGMDLGKYKDKLISRFSNPNIADTILRLASDGSKKIANAILRPLEEGLERGLCVDSLILALSLWRYYFIYKDENGNPMPIDDPKKEELLEAACGSRSFLEAAGLSKAGLEHPELFDKMDRFHALLSERGVRAVLKEFLS